MQFYKTDIKTVLTKLQTTKQGLTSEEATKRLAEFGPNKLKEGKKPSIFKLFFNQLHDWLIYVLLIATVLTFIVGDYIAGIIILAIVIVNAVIGLLQEEKANRAVEALKEMTAPKSLVRRDNQIIEIESSELVVGDIVILAAGRFIPADLRLTASSNLQIEESSLTGESVAVYKDANKVFEQEMALGVQETMAFSSTFVTCGRGVGVVVKTAMETEIGKIATILESHEKEETPLQKRLNELGKILGIIIIAISVLIFIIHLIQKKPWVDGFDLKDTQNMFIIAISLAVAAIPEGLVAIVAVVLALGTTRMSKQNAIVKTLPAVETLGSVNVICSDKTGTLTQNKMTVTQIYTANKLKTIAKKEKTTITEDLLLKTFVLCNDATLKNDVRTGDPTEIALLDLANVYGIEQESLTIAFPRIADLPFDSKRKLMSTAHLVEGDYTIYTKGAFDNLIAKCSHVLIADKKEILTDELRAHFLAEAEKMSLAALRVLAAAYKSQKSEIALTDFEKDLTLIGLAGLIDPPREEVKPAIINCHKAGIKVIMITGDHKNTANAIAQELGILTPGKKTITGSELAALSEKELEETIDDYSVFARVTPEDKLKIVGALKKKGYTVSMTGDGVNDAPALKSADIGVAMGITGTDVAKSASDMILTDDNFTTIVHAIEEGRNIYNNIKKSVIFLLSCNLGEVIAIALAIILGWPAPLLATQILWINLITDSLPAISLGVDLSDPDVMREKPRPKNESFFAHGTGTRAIIGGVLIGLLTLVAFIIGLTEKGVNLGQISSLTQQAAAFKYASTMAFVVLATSQLFYSFSMRHHNKSIFQVGLFKNIWLVISLILGVLSLALIVLIPPFRFAFGLVRIGLLDWLFVFVLAIIPLFINEIIKFGMRIKEKKQLQVE